MSNESDGKEITCDLILTEDRPEIMCPWCGAIEETPDIYDLGERIECCCGRMFRLTSIRYSTEKVES